jgi:hypothetical protein
VRKKRSDPALKARNTRHISAFQALFDRAYRNQGRRASLCSALAPVFIFRAFGSVSTFCAKHTAVVLVSSLFNLCVLCIFCGLVHLRAYSPQRRKGRRDYAEKTFKLRHPPLGLFH